MLCEPLDINEHYKHLAEIFGETTELYEHVHFDTIEAAALAAAAAAAQLAAEIKQARDQRRDSIDRTMHSVIDVIATMFHITNEELVESIIDTEVRTECFHRFFQVKGSEAVVFSFCPESNEPYRVKIMHEHDMIKTDQCVIIYRTDNTTEINAKNLSTVRFEYYTKSFRRKNF